MSVLDIFRQEYVRGKVVQKYNLVNGNVGMVVEQQGSLRRYHVEFRDGYRGPTMDNLFGLVKRNPSPARQSTLKNSYGPGIASN